MVYFKRGNWGYNPYKRWYNQGSYNGVKRRAVQSIRASNTQNSTINFAFKVNYAFSANFSKSSQTGVAAINIYDVLMHSENFINLRNMYDNVKLNGVNVRINVTDATTSVSDLTSVKTINVITAWDKTGLSISDCEFQDANNNTIQDEDFDSTPAVSFINKIGSKITGYGSVKKGLLNAYQRFSRKESCWPTTSNEKSLYIPTKMFNFYETGYDTTTTKHSISGDYSANTLQDQLANPNPCIPFENVSVPWKPTLLVGVFKTEINNNVVEQYADCDTVVFNAEFTIPCTFKGLKGDK